MTTLEKVGIRRLCFYIEKRLREIARSRSLQSPRNGDKWTSFEVCSLMEDILQRRGIADYEFYVDGGNILIGILPSTSDLIWIELTVG